MPTDQTRNAKGQLGYTREDYEQAAEKYGSVREAAKEMGVSRQAVIDQWQRYEIVNPYTGEIPGQNTDQP